MKKLFLFLTLALGFSIHLLGCRGDGRLGSQVNKAKPLFDRQIGLPEGDIVREYGAPKDIFVKHTNEFFGELRRNLKSKATNENAEIKELYYRNHTGEHIFWLTQSPNGEWRVISDVYIPVGVVF